MRTFVTLILLLLLISPAASQEKRISLLFAGDAMQHMPQVRSARTEDDSYRYDSCFHLVKEKIAAVDIAGLNFETTLGRKPYSGYPIFSSPDAFAVALKNAGFNIFFQANNHAVDRGRKGLERTIDMLDSIGIRHTGTFKSDETRSLYYPLMIIKNGIRIAFLNYVYDTNGLAVKPPNIVNLIDSNRIKSDLCRTQLYKPDIIIAQMHWGEEYHTTPSPQQRRVAELLLRNGVRIVIGHHPHVIQPLVVKKENGYIRSAVYYSLGNFISNQQRTHTDGGMLAEIVISRSDDASPVVIESCDYSFVWVRKEQLKGRINYQLIPSWNDKNAAMGTGEKQKMDIFVRNAGSIVQKSL
jgi:poly-gamma-glutamate synthesis protein (capsule biosynthesis protein)